MKKGNSSKLKNTNYFNISRLKEGKGQISRISEPSGVRFFSYDQKGNLEKTLRRINSEDAESKEFSEFFAFDALGRIMVKTGPDGEAIRFEYGKRGLPVSIEGFLEDLRYNAAGLITSVTYANGAENRRSYDLRQRLTGLETSDPNGAVFQELSYRYGATGNITRIEDGTEAGEAANASQSFLYDATDRLIRASGNYGIIDYAYDGTGNMIWKGSPQRQSAGHIADPDINLGRMIYGGSAGSKNRKEKANKPGPHAITHTQSGLIFDYDANGNRISATAGGGVSTGDAKYEWNWQDRMKRFEGKEATADYLYGYDGKRAVKQVETPGGISETLYVSDDYEIRDGTAYKYVFTDGQRIASIAKSADSGREETKEILLKEGWNSLSFSIRPEEKSPRGVFRSVLPQIKAVYSFDPKSGNYLVWRPGNLSNLTEITTGKGYFVQMKQDATLILEGSKAAPLIHLERGWQLIPTGVERETGVKALIKSISGKVSSVWYYDKEKKAGKYHFTNPELNGLNTLKSVLPDTAIWVQMETAGFYLPQTRQSGEKTFYHPDHLGSTNFTTDSEGKVTGRYEYYPYGKERLQPATNPFYKHTNHETDLESALVYSVHRYRDTITGQFLSYDPLAEKFPGLSPYAYVENNPIIHVDPLGLETEGLGMGFSFTMPAFAFNFAIQKVNDDKGNIDTHITVGLGSSVTKKAGLSFTIDYVGTNAERIYDLEGFGGAKNLSIGGQVGHVPLAAAIEFNWGKGYQGITGSLGLGTSGIGINTLTTYTMSWNNFERYIRSSTINLDQFSKNFKNLINSFVDTPEKTEDNTKEFIKNFFDTANRTNKNSYNNE